MLAQTATEIKDLSAIYADITARLLANSPFTTARTAYDGYERLTLIGDINIGLDYIGSMATLHLSANSRTHFRGSLHIADRRGRGDYESYLTPQGFAQFAKDAFNLEMDTANLLTAYIAAKMAHGAILNGRLDRGLDIAAGGHVKRNGSGFQVNSQTGTGTHTVSHTADGWSCTCLDRAPRVATHKGCKHVAATWMTIKAKLIPEAKPAQARINGNNHRQTTCEKCQRNWQECDCPPDDQLPEPARITTLKNIDQPLTVAEQKQAARNANGIKQEAGRRTSATFSNPQRWS